MKDKKIQNFELLRNKASIIAILNQCLKTKLDLYNKYIGLTKETMTKCISNENAAISIFNTYIYEIQKDYDTLKVDCEKNYFPIHQSLIVQIFNEINWGKPILNKCINEEFSLNYYKDKSESIIRGLKNSIQSSKEFSIFREPKREWLVEIAKGNKEIVKTTAELQQNMLYECKNLNKLRNKIKNSDYLISKMKKNIAVLKKYLEDEKSKNKKDDKPENISNQPTNENEENEISRKKTFKIGKHNFRIFTKRSFLNLELDEENDEKRAQNKSSEINRGYISNRTKEKSQKLGLIKRKKTIKKSKLGYRKKNTIIQQFIKVEDLFNISMDDDDKEDIIVEELHSDDENNFENKIKQQKKISKCDLNKIDGITIPTINLKQIEYNKIRVIKEVDRYSIQRREYKRYNIKELKSKIEQMNHKANLLEQKEKVMEEYIKKYKEKYNEMKPILDSLTAYKKRLSSALNHNSNIDNIKEDENDDLDFYDDKIKEKGQEKNQEKEQEKHQEKEEHEIDIKIKNQINIKNSNDFKISAIMRKAHKKNIYGKELKQMVENKFFKNKLKEKAKNRERANSK
mgnify:CR=1 FL=1